MTIKGFEQLSLVDFPNHISCVIFLSGCNLRCGYCYNHKLFINPSLTPTISEGYVHEFINSKKNFLEGICVSGGEPTTQADLTDFITRLKKHKLPIKLDTNGTNPLMIEKILKEKLVDYIALDIKVPLNKNYSDLTNAGNNLISNIKKTLNLLSKSDIKFELRTTIIPTIHSISTIRTMRENVVDSLDSRTDYNRFTWFLQSFLPINCLVERFNKIKPTSSSQLEIVAEELKCFFPNVAIRL